MPVPGKSQSTSRMRSSEAVSRCIELSKGVVDIFFRSVCADTRHSRCHQASVVNAELDEPIQLSLLNSRPHDHRHLSPALLKGCSLEKRFMRREPAATVTCACLEEWGGMDRVHAWPPFLGNITIYRCLYISLDEWWADAHSQPSRGLRDRFARSQEGSRCGPMV